MKLVALRYLKTNLKIKMFEYRKSVFKMQSLCSDVLTHSGIRGSSTENPVIAEGQTPKDTELIKRTHVEGIGRIGMQFSQVQRFLLVSSHNTLWCLPHVFLE